MLKKRKTSKTAFHRFGSLYFQRRTDPVPPLPHVPHASQSILSSCLSSLVTCHSLLLTDCWICTLILNLEPFYCLS